MAVNDVYRLTSAWLVQGSLVLNVYTYKSLSASTNATEIDEAFNTQIITPNKDIIHNLVDLQWTKTENMNSPTDFITTIPGDPPSGSRGGELAASTLTFSIYSPTKNKTIRGGRKSIGGISAGDLDGSEADLSGTLPTALDAYVAAISADLLDDSDVAIARPIVIKRNYSVVNGKPRYTIPAIATTTNHYVADNWAYHAILGTQTTRKMGRGV